MHSELQPFLLQMEKAREAFIAEIADFGKEKRAVKSKEGWNMLQVMEHLLISEQGTLEYLRRKTQAPFSEIPVADHVSAEQSRQLNDALLSQNRWQAPPVMPLPTGTQSFENMLIYWEGLREEWSQFLFELQPAYFDRQVFNHPLSGRLNLYQTLEFTTNHILHHIHQLRRIAAEKQGETAV